MESEELRQLTASERLSLEEEYEMQRKWREDCDKCTFIILSKESYLTSSLSETSKKEIECMIGDVNIFYTPNSHDRSEGEVEIMIAEPSARGKSMGKEAVCLVMKYAQDILKTTLFTCKIGFENTTSLHLFQSLGFIEISRSDVFKELTLSLSATEFKRKGFPWLQNYTLEIIK
ncbi:N-acetyltransferase 9-like protein isoform X2 [Physella acuta]|nr:N-acetyltransferase 9-like protein isoform X2 [Physella acuta]XP_059169002.1 N-acetyltransferase 9-like protein isoform X2 [Physella acuta]XP_059169003.1 N-acetyltransferase 9-like protein isoform X2 [Physella acuta]